MKATELRIGNLVQVSLISGQGNTLVKEIGAQDIARIKEETGYFVYSPLPITEQVLLDCGFERNGLKYFWKHQGYHLEHDGVDWCVMPFANSEHVITYITNLHQLQNAYFVITQKELTYKGH